MTAIKHRTINAHSTLLTAYENETVFKILGPHCTTLATSVIQLYLSDKHGHAKWNKRFCGVVCFVKDRQMKSFFIRLFDVRHKKMLWEQELYNQFVYKVPREYFHTFEADNCQAGMNFANTEEAIKFMIAIFERIQERVQRLQVRRGQYTFSEDPTFVAEQVEEPPSVEDKKTKTQHPLRSLFASASAGSLMKFLKRDDHKKESNSKLTTADIGSPSDMRPVTRDGWDPEKGFIMNNMNIHMQKLFHHLGIKPDDNLDKDTFDFIYDFVETNGGIEALKAEFGTTKAAPPWSVNQTTSQHSVLQHTTQVSSKNGHPPHPPPPPPAPPAPPSNRGPPVVVQPGTSSSATVLRTVVPSASSNLMDEIKIGIQMKKHAPSARISQNVEFGSKKGQDTSLVAALSQALAVRKFKLHGPEFSMDLGSDEEDDDYWDD